jgi:hypothetical protein
MTVVIGLLIDITVLKVIETVMFITSLLCYQSLH